MKKTKGTLLIVDINIVENIYLFIYIKMYSLMVYINNVLNVFIYITSEESTSNFFN